MDDLFTAVKALILQLTNLYPANNIFKGFQNDYPIPDNSNFIIMVVYPNIHSHCLLPEYDYDTTAETETWTQIDEATFQIDFYGDNAIAASALFRLALQSAYATNYFLDNGYDCAVGIVKDTRNLTNPIDREMFTDRYSVIFTMQFNNILTVSTPGATQVNINVVLADVQQPT